MKIRNLLITLLLACASTAAHAQEGAWKGELNLQGMKLPLVFNFDAKGCTIDSPSQGAMGIAAEKHVAEDGTLSVTIPAIGATFKGKMEGGTIKGTFGQSGLSLPLTLTQGKPVVNRPQTPVAPFPYKEESMTFTHAGYTFGGTLFLPEGCTKQTPVVLMITGSGQQNRDEEMLDHKPFAVIADALARQGIASLRYDDRGWGDASVHFTDFTTNDFKQDAEAALKWLQNRFDKVGILGHSEGGTIALMLAEEGKPHFVVSLAGMAVSGKATLLAQNRMLLSTTGIPAQIIDDFCHTFDKVYDQLAAGKAASEISLDGAPDVLKPAIEKSLQQMDSKYIRNFITIDPSPLLGKIKCPVLALNGTKDTQVDCTTNLDALRKGLTACQHVLKPMEGLNHLFQHSQTGSALEYQQIEETISPEVLSTITEWIKNLK